MSNFLRRKKFINNELKNMRKSTIVDSCADSDTRNTISDDTLLGEKPSRVYQDVDTEEM